MERLSRFEYEEKYGEDYPEEDDEDICEDCGCRLVTYDEPYEYQGFSGTYKIKQCPRCG